MEQNSKTKFINREAYPQILDWLPESEVLALSGPRQAGKTTLLLKLKEDIKNGKVVYINFEDTRELNSFQKSPTEFINLHLSAAQKTYFLFDEFQYVKKAGKVLKLFSDQYPQAKFIITGSSSLKIRQIASFLVGRVIFFNLYPLSFGEFLSSKDSAILRLWQNSQKTFQDFVDNKDVKPGDFIYEEKLQSFLEEYIIYGGYPAVVTSTTVDKKKTRLSALIETYIERDIIRFLQIGNYLEFRNFVSLSASVIGNLANVSSLSRESNLSYPETKRFMAVLQKTFVADFLKPYSTNKTTEIRKSPKVYFLDLGLRNALIEDFRAFDLRPDRGALVENFVYQNLLFHNKRKSFKFWRTKQGAEVDFILELENEIVPLEVKYQSFDRPSFSRGFLNFLETYKPQKAIILTKNYTRFTVHQKTKVLFLPIYFV